MRVLYRYLRVPLVWHRLPSRRAQEQCNGVIQAWGDYYDDVAN